MTIVGEAIGCQVAWPKKFMLVNNEVLIVKNVWSAFQLLLHWSAMSGKCQTAGNSKSTLIARRFDDAKPDQLIFVPYNIGYHWVLLVIDLSSMIVYSLDSFYHGEINTSLKFGLRIYGITKGMNRKPIWQVVEGSRGNLEGNI
ncbi:uncharacterized protein LOC114268668 isoform X1 [Camellia sinensis]|uniref:uncharacterized protein LOC114268668 isoform X1 n=1 Tax=Camellia sinensis TaxID=4442 RepID=UPI001035845D|nr:uncharacterized protein LOC114268668 isoform X1 [Camellia sinensis]